VINDQLGRGDFFMCASEKQRDFWLGQLAGVGRVSPANYDDDPTLRTLIDVVPFGLGTPPPPPRGHVLKGVHPAIGLDDRVVIWGGGLYSWFDSHTVVRAMAQLRTSRPDLRLFFMGGRHPNPDVPEMPITRTTRSLAQELGLADKSIVFNDSWIDYDQRHRWLADSDVGVSAHLDHVETEFSFRTRILDYIWAGLPIVCTSGDSLGRLVASRQLGITVPPGDVVAMADALDRASADDDLRATAAANLAQLAEEMQWDRMLEPLLEWVRRPRHAADLVERFGPIEIHTPSTLGAMVKRGSDLARRGLGVARREGVGVAARRTAEVARRRLQG
jgi:glycosyltransferase involved in cell wall biosynthesis